MPDFGTFCSMLGMPRNVKGRAELPQARIASSAPSAARGADRFRSRKFAMRCMKNATNMNKICESFA